MSNFITYCINGDALLTEVDTFIDEWHNSDSNLSIYEYLGMSKQEYALFVQDEVYLAVIVKAHKDGVNILKIISEQYAVAARSNDLTKSKKLERWLKNKGLWD